ncbi:MAG: thiamine pyrophosphate-binding protein [Burkholderiales bacterium]
MTTVPTGGQVLAASLARRDVDAVFMIPGVQLDWAVDGLRGQAGQIRPFVPRHEQKTTYMADGYFQASGKPGIAMVVPGLSGPAGRESIGVGVVATRCVRIVSGSEYVLSRLASRLTRRPGDDHEPRSRTDAFPRFGARFFQPSASGAEDRSYAWPKSPIVRGMVDDAEDIALVVDVKFARASV